MPRSESNKVSPLKQIRPANGRIRPETAARTVDLPEPEAPNSAVIPAGGQAKRTSRENSPRASAISASSTRGDPTASDAGNPFGADETAQAENDRKRGQAA